MWIVGNWHLGGISGEEKKRLAFSLFLTPALPESPSSPPPPPPPCEEKLSPPAPPPPEIITFITVMTELNYSN
ncbi:hypothetical protein SDJN02_27071, partial [Cucurbita argyrosperma subsp. argyrosperma]